MRRRGPSSVGQVSARGVVRRMPGGRLVLDGVTAAFPAGSVTAVVAANGVGKSTLARVLAGVDRPDAGTVIGPSRAVYLLPDRVPVLAGCSARTVTAALAPALGRDGQAGCLGRLEEGLELLGSSHAGSTPLDRLSKGNLQKAFLAVAYALRPAVVVLDEPTTGLDPASSAGVGEIARELAGHGSVVVVTAHERVPYADVQLALSAGQLGAPAASPLERVFLVDLETSAGAVDSWRAHSVDLPYEVLPGTTASVVRLRVGSASVPAVLRAALDRGDVVVGVVVERRC